MDNIIDVAQKVAKKGGKMYLVGGAVRDEIMGISSSDEDYCIVGLDEKEFLELFPGAKIMGKDFPVFKLYGKDIALARTEKKVSKGYKGFNIYANKNITIEQDLYRRDITINAIAKDVLTSEIIDPYGGVNDIEDKIIRPVSSAFCEDPLRVYRAARFAAKYQFSLANETIRMMKELRDELSTISPERVYEELKKVLKTDTPSLFFYCLKDTEVLDVHFKEIYELIGVPQPKVYHPEGDVFTHTMIVLDKVATRTKDEAVRFAALCHDFGKALTPKEILPRHIGHEDRADVPIKNLCNRLKLPNKWRKGALVIAKLHMKMARIKEMKPYKQAKYLYMVKNSVVSLKNMEIIVNADEMLDRGMVEFADMAEEIFKRVNGSTLVQKGITVESVGKTEFINRLLQEQAVLIAQMEQKAK